MKVSIRREKAGDEDAIGALIAAAFDGHPHSDGREPAIVAALRTANALTVSLVAQDDAGAIVGHIVASPVKIGSTDGRWFGLGPVAVSPARQGEGIGSALINATIAELHSLSAAGCTVVGEPGYYGRFGFALDRGLTFEGVPAEFFMVLPLAGPVPHGCVRYHAAFDAPNAGR